jgi:hypothetical protein
MGAKIIDWSSPFREGKLRIFLRSSKGISFITSEKLKAQKV